MNIKKRFLSLLLCAAMLFSGLPVTAFAEGAEPETATPSNATALSVEDVQKLIDELPTAEALAAMTQEEQGAVYTNLCTAYEAYNALTDEQKAEVTGAEIFDSLFDVFNGMVNTLENQDSYNINEDTVKIDDSCGDNCPGHTITGSGRTTQNHIEVTGGTHNITIQNINISAENSGFFIYDGATVNLTLIGINKLESDERPGLQVLEGAALTITEVIDGGSLEAISSGYGTAGIGGGSFGSCGTIIIESGTVTAIGGQYGAGIGSGRGAAGGTIIVTGGTVIVQGGERADDIGSGNGRKPSEKIEISDNATVKRPDGSPAIIGISHVADTTTWDKNDTDHWRPCQVENCGQSHDFLASTKTSHSYSDTGNVNANGELVYTCEANCGYEKKYTCTKIDVTAQPDKMTYTEGDTLDLSGLTIKATFTDNSGDTKTLDTLTYNSQGVTCSPAHGTTLTTAHNGKPITVTIGQQTTSTTGQLTVNPAAAKKIQYIERSWNGSEVTEETKDISDYTEITSTNLPTDWNTENGGYYVVTGEVNFSERVTVTGAVHLILTDNCALTASKGITVSEGNSLTIYATSEGESMGKLTATGEGYTAGIGGFTTYNDNGPDATHTSGGTITIHGGSVTATGNSGAGIGGGMTAFADKVGNGGNITIYGGDITATGKNGGAGIGGGSHDQNDFSPGGDGGEISIYGGKVKATGEGGVGVASGAGIGGGSFGNGGIINIHGGEIEATSVDGAGIGGGKPHSSYGGKGGTISIAGGTVTAKSTNGAGIGGGITSLSVIVGASGGTISITGSNTKVTATGGTNAYDIGGGATNVPSDKIVVTVTVTKDGTTPATIGISHVADTTKWDSNEYKHWRPCQVPDCNEAEHQSGMADHTWDSGTVKNNELVYSCKVCEYEKKYSCTGITVANYPKLEYNAGDTLDLSGLKITATFGEGDNQEQAELSYISEGVTCYIGYSQVTHGATLNKRSHNGKTLYVTFGSGYSIYAQVGNLVVKSTDTGVSSVTIGNKTVTTSSNNVFSVALDFGSDIPTEASAVQITLADKAATHTTPATKNGGQTWTFTVTAESGAAQQYTIQVSVTPPTDAECIAQAKAAIEGRDWTVAQSAANTSEAVKTWIENQLAGMSLYEADASVTVTACTSAADNTNGSFTFTVTLSKGVETVTTDTVTGTITATITYPVTVNNGTGSGPYAENDTVTITANKPAAGQEFSHWTVEQGGVTLANPNSSATTFTMPAGAVTVTANFKPISSGEEGGGGVSRPTYRPDVEDTEGGDVSVKPSNPEKGDKVTITPKPEDGYEVEDVIVTDKDGRPVNVTDNGDGTWTFTQPGGRVTVEVIFRETPPEPLPFTDVSESAWYYDAVRYVYEHGLMTGTSDTTFAPNSKLTRAQAVQILYNLEGQPEATGETTFTDVKAGQWYETAILWAEQTGVVDGYEDGTFQPDKVVNREEFAQMLYNYARFKDLDTTAQADLSQFPDGEQVSDWAATAMSWANGNGLINGHDDGTIDARGTTLRSQAASILMHFDLNLVK